jgi:hypothetical protein
VVGQDSADTNLYWETMDGGLARQSDSGMVWFDGHAMWATASQFKSKLGPGDLDLKEQVSAAYYWSSCKNDTKENKPTHVFEAMVALGSFTITLPIRGFRP